MEVIEMRLNFINLWGNHVSRIIPGDIGCGGGKNIKNLLSRAPQGHVTGVDYSSESVAKSKRVNYRAIQEGRAQAQEASLTSLYTCLK
jgi:trans-aconitate methyltransferase